MSTHRVKVLLVEDNAGDRRLVQEMLHDAADAEIYELTQVASIADALPLLATDETPDIVLLDLTLPDADGLDGLKRITRSAGRIPVVVITGRSEEQMARNAVREGAQDYLLKGHLNAVWLCSSIRLAIERSALLTRLELVQQRLVGLERDRAVSETAIAAAHEINNPLTVIVGNLELLLDEATDGPLHERLDEIRQQALRVRDVIATMTAAQKYVTTPYLKDLNMVDLERSAESS